MPCDDAFLAAAVSIGDRIAAEAIWCDGQCSWMGAVAEPEQRGRSEYHALGPSLYDGTAGVGLFLAQLALVTGGALYRRTAAGALHHAISHATSMQTPRDDGFHAGPLGIAWAAGRAAILLDDGGLRAGAREVLGGTRLLSGPRRCPDLVMGSAGAIVGLLAFDEPELTEAAVAAGDALLACATVRSGRRSWAIPGRRYPAHLCGVGHGASGIALALLELHAATGEDRFREGAEGALAYERSWLDDGSGTWPDLRIGGQRLGDPPTLRSDTEATWCRGEAGIALVRLRTREVLGPGPHDHDAEVAVETTRRHLADSLPHAIADLSLCHGAAGAGDALLSAADADRDRWRAAANVSIALGHAVLERHTDAGEPWPGGTSGHTPGLFLGTSGVGWFLLRLHDRTVASPLAVPTRG
jgi:lantibiotic biosynthesis protein